MINPCNSTGIYIQYDPVYKLPTHYGSRATLQYVKPTPELYSKHKLLLFVSCKHLRMTFLLLILYL